MPPRGRRRIRLCVRPFLSLPMWQTQRAIVRCVSAHCSVRTIRAGTWIDEAAARVTLCQGRVSNLVDSMSGLGGVRKAGVRSYAFPAGLGSSRRLFLWLTGEGRRSARSFTDRRLAWQKCG